MTAPTIFAEATLAQTLERIRRLGPDAPARWGRMNVAQMLAHCQEALRLAVGETVIPRVLIGRLFGRMAKRSLTSDKPWRKGLPTAKEFRIHDARDFGTEREQLMTRLEHLSRAGPAVLTKAPHPFFGPMTPAEWDLLVVRHLDHHLRQFGA